MGDQNTEEGLHLHRTLHTGVSGRPNTACLCGLARRVACESGASLGSLDGTEALQLIGLHRYFLAEADLAGGTADERDTVGVERLVDGGGTGLSAGDGDTSGLSGGGGSGEVASTDALDDGSLHRELDPVEGDEPNDIL